MIQLTPPFGFMCFGNVTGKTKNDITKPYDFLYVLNYEDMTKKVNNMKRNAMKDIIIKVLAVLPIFAQIIGIWRIATAASAKNCFKRAEHIIRGTLEFLNLAIILLIVDGILSLKTSDEPIPLIC